VLSVRDWSGKQDPCQIAEQRDYNKKTNYKDNEGSVGKGDNNEMI
jgi:hypothetical protein